MSMPALPVFDCSRGAPLGRGNRLSLCPVASRTFHLRRLRLDRFGYDEGGAYWGLGAPVWWACCPSGSLDVYVRAPDRDAAKALVRKAHGGAKFFR